MFLRKFILTSLILSASVGSSVTVGSDVNGVFRVDAENVDQENCKIFVSTESSYPVETFNERLMGWLVGWLNDVSAHDLKIDGKARPCKKKAVASPDDFRVKPKLFKKVTERNSVRAQEAERKTLQSSQKKLFRRVTKSFKVYAKPIHQPK